jgi:hypothetical protein
MGADEAMPPLVGAGVLSKPVTAASNRWIVLTPLVAATFFSKLAVPPFGEMGISIGVGMILLAALFAGLTGHMEFSRFRLIGFLLLLAFMGLSATFRGLVFSPASLLFFLAIHAPYVLQIKKEDGLGDGMVGMFSDLAIFFACCGVAQFLLQFVIGPALAFPIENFVPDMWQVQAFNKQGTLEYGSSLYRANGIFLLEPSFFSQLMAVALVFELSGPSRLWRMMIFTFGLLLSYSGTGILILIVCLPLAAVFYGRWQLIPLALIGGAVMLVGAEALNLDLFIHRSAELGSSGSSGFARFVGGFYLFDKFLWDSPVHALLGYGAGSFKFYAPSVSVPVAEMAMPKMVFEYGVLGGGAYFILIAAAVFSARVPFLARLAVFITFFLNGNYIIFSHGLALALFIWPKSGETVGKTKVGPRYGVNGRH